MGQMKHQRYGSGELYDKMVEIETRMMVLGINQRYSYFAGTGFALFGISLTTLALSFVVMEEARLVYIGATVVFALLAFAVWMNAKKRYDSTVARLPNLARSMLEDDENASASPERRP